MRQSRPPYYSLWCNIKQRCHDSCSTAYPAYGGRGISFHAPWRFNYTRFESDLLTEIGPKPSSVHTIDRINTLGNYEPGNIRWLTIAEQQRNRRDNILVTIDEAEGPITVMEAAERLGVKYHTLRHRLQRAGKLTGGRK